MKIKSFTVRGAGRSTVEVIPAKSICFLRGRGGDALMDLMREALMDPLPHVNAIRDQNVLLVLHCDVEIDNKDYRVCYIRSADGGENRIAANFDERGTHYSRKDTKEYLRKCAERNLSPSNVFIGAASINASRDSRPIFIYNYFDRLDEAIDISPMLDALASLGRQVFVAVCPSYPDVKHEHVQMCDIDL